MTLNNHDTKQASNDFTRDTAAKAVACGFGVPALRRGEGIEGKEISESDVRGGRSVKTLRKGKDSFQP